mmetsp:Transcript_11820/g.16394  ORF Transcript_11820/g.16394 Transcript_11820/m.16394 type:complete len:380 (+) Transcript_11820:114-1253(+)
MSSAAVLTFRAKDTTKNADEAQKGRAKRIDIQHPNLPSSGAIVKIGPAEIIKDATAFGAKKLNNLDRPLEKFEETGESNNRIDLDVAVYNEKSQNITLCQTHGPAISILTPNGSSYVKYSEGIFVVVCFNDCTPFSHQSENLTILITLKTGKGVINGNIQYHMKKNKSSSSKKQKKDVTSPESVFSPSQAASFSTPLPLIDQTINQLQTHSEIPTSFITPQTDFDPSFEDIVDWPSILLSDPNFSELLKNNVPEKPPVVYEVPAPPKPGEIPQWLRSKHWFFKDLSAEHAVELLEPLRTGTYLARSSSQPGAFAISFKTDKGVVHWRFTMEGIRIKGADDTIYDSVSKILETFDQLETPISQYNQPANNIVANNNNNNS